MIVSDLLMIRFPFAVCRRGAFLLILLGLTVTSPGAGADGAEFATYLSWPIWLGGESFLLWVSAMQKEHDDPLGSAKGRAIAAGSLVTGLQ